MGQIKIPSIHLHRYWIVFKRTEGEWVPHGMQRGCGVTAFSKEDAFNILSEKGIDLESMPDIESIQTDFDVSILDQNHVVPNMGVIVLRGIWYPVGFQQ